MKTTYNNVLYLFIDSSTLFAPALADLKETMVSHVINEFKFQQAIHEKGRGCTAITRLLEVLRDICRLFVTTEGERGLWKGIVGRL